MSPHAYSEDQLVEQPAIRLFGDLRWETVSVMEETFGCPDPSRRPSPNGRAGRATRGLRCQCQPRYPQPFYLNANGCC